MSQAAHQQPEGGHHKAEQRDREEVRALRAQIENLQKTAAEPKSSAAVAVSGNERTTEVTTIHNYRKVPGCIRISTERDPENENMEGDRFARCLPQTKPTNTSEQPS
ncbi:uncharacterized protein ATNIH1004_005878 [Aspergillus tanneri]|uniref:Uncharacterized protein n=1 Tax=Aspergillus tanneri TaxID=1220188 RepID=A0A5M9MJJ7_9EURO|nr:uncharacterized protein ATNIH1004_005878 [Aspergillus tanneri]KAA8647188.1 hypothetical protein ATNIH1004_005878 [Aspergillus tanneri]